MTSFTLRYDGGLADNNVMDMYDAARGLAGFQRSLALVTHLVINGEIITQAPSLRGAQILSSTPQEGSWKVTAVILGGLFTLTSAPRDSTAGHMVFSVYDYVVKSTLGFHVDLTKSLGVQAEQELEKKKITREKLDSLMEKTESSVADMHRPIVASKTAQQARIDAFFEWSPSRQVGPLMTPQTYEFIATTVRQEDYSLISGLISSFNINTYKGRIFSFEEQRPIPFELEQSARDAHSLMLITSSLQSNVSDRFSSSGSVTLRARRYESSTGRLKSLQVDQVSQR